MSGSRVLASALAGLVIALGCGVPDHDPSETVRRYLDAVAADPIRTLTLVTPRFHAAHGLRFEEVGDQPFAPERTRARRFDDETLELERARLGWLTVLTKPFFAIQARRFTRSVVAEEIQGDVARVTVQVEASARPTLEIPFTLVRTDAGAPWRIDAITLGRIEEGDLGRAFLVAPDAEIHRRIDARRRGSQGRSPAVEPAQAAPEAAFSG